MHWRSVLDASLLPNLDALKVEEIDDFAAAPLRPARSGGSWRADPGGFPGLLGFQFKVLRGAGGFLILRFLRGF